MTKKKKDKDGIKQPKYSKRKEQQTEKGDGLEEYSRDSPNFSAGEREEKKKEKGKK